MQKIRHGPRRRITHNAIASKPQVTSTEAPLLAALIAGGISLINTGAVL